MTKASLAGIKGRYLATTVAGIALLHVLQNAAVYTLLPPVEQLLMAPSARLSTGASMKILTGASGKTTVPISRPSSTARSRALAKRCCVARSASADRRNGGNPRARLGRRIAPQFLFVADLVEARFLGRPDGIAALAFGPQAHGPIEQAGIEVAEGRSGPRAGGRACPCRRRPARRRRSRSTALPVRPICASCVMRREPGAQPVHQGRETRETGIDGRGVVDGDGRCAARPSTRNAMAMRWSRAASMRAPPLGLGAAARARSGCPRPSTTSTPQAASPRATAPRRSLSLTRSSASPFIVVVALGKGGRDGEDRILVDHGRRPACRHHDTRQPARLARGYRRQVRRPARAGRGTRSWRPSRSRSRAVRCDGG